MNRQEGFSSGEYHRIFEAITTAPVVSKLWRGYLHRSYARSAELVAEAGWENPVTRPAAHMLLCGTGSSETSSMFVKTVRAQNPTAGVTIIDMAEFPLQRTRGRLLRDLGEERVGTVAVRQENALQLPFQDTFTGIETDAFMQFFDHEQKGELLAQWAKALMPGGVVTTRDFVMDTGRYTEQKEADVIRGSIAVLLHEKAYSTTRDDLTGLFQDAGFEIQITPARRSRLPLMKDIIARKR